jgi:Secretion system C-terminal sorting domain
MKQFFSIFGLIMLFAACQHEVQKTNGVQPSEHVIEIPTATPLPNQNNENTGTVPMEKVDPLEEVGLRDDYDHAMSDEYPSERICIPPMVEYADSKDYYDEGARSAAPTTASEGSSSKKNLTGKLTAGEINDFHKWKMWGDLSQDALKKYQELWQIQMHDRYCVMVRNQEGGPIIDAEVSLMNASEIVLWRARTDNTGKAELWTSMETANATANDLKIKIVAAQQTAWIKSATPFKKGINHCKIRQACDTKNQVDLVFAVDATGSMGDEIRYLQDELLDVLQKVKQQHQVSLRTGSVFYRDHGDEYVTRISGLTSDLNTTTTFIGSQSANGGGDGPEAVDDALIASIEQMSWRKTALTRILFLILDAPPHHSPEHQARLKRAMQLAATKGIRIVPLVASGGGYEMDKSMEYLMRTMALATNGTYVFLTNHSGIGNHHTAPSTDAYKVETLNQILLRVVASYVHAPGCDEAEWQEEMVQMDEEALIIPMESTPEEKIEIRLDCYPNPADNVLWITSTHEMDEVYISDNSGKLLHKLNVQTGQTRLDTSTYPSGIYYIKVLAGNKWLSKKFIVMHI